MGQLPLTSPPAHYFLSITCILLVYYLCVLSSYFFVYYLCVLPVYCVCITCRISWVFGGFFLYFLWHKKIPQAL